jgi:hypothetical protein
VGRGRSARRAESKDQSQEEKRALATLWFEGELRNKLVLGCKKLLAAFSVQADKQG